MIDIKKIEEEIRAELEDCDEIEDMIDTCGTRISITGKKNGKETVYVSLATKMGVADTHELYFDKTEYRNDGIEVIRGDVYYFPDDTDFYYLASMIGDIIVGE